MNGQKLSGRTVLHHGDRLKFDDYELRFDCEELLSTRANDVVPGPVSALTSAGEAQRVDDRTAPVRSADSDCAAPTRGSRHGDRGCARRQGLEEVEHIRGAPPPSLCAAHPARPIYFAEGDLSPVRHGRWHHRTLWHPPRGLAMNTRWALLREPASGDTSLGFWVVIWVLPALAPIWSVYRLLRKGFGPGCSASSRLRWRMLSPGQAWPSSVRRKPPRWACPIHRRPDAWTRRRRARS